MYGLRPVSLCAKYGIEFGVADISTQKKGLSLRCVVKAYGQIRAVGHTMYNYVGECDDAH